MTTLGQALTAVRQRVDEQTAVSWTDAELRGWICEGVTDIARKTDTVQKVVDIALTSGVQMVTSLPADFQRLNRVEYIRSTQDTRQLEIREYNEMDSHWHGAQQTTKGQPLYVGTRGYPPYLQLLLYPIPNESGSVLRIFYYASPARLATDGSADGVNLEIPMGWEDLVYDYATYLAQRRDGNPAWQDSKAICEQNLGAMIEQTRHWHDQPGFIVSDDDMPGFIGGWW